MQDHQMFPHAFIALSLRYKIMTNTGCVHSPPKFLILCYPISEITRNVCGDKNIGFYIIMSHHRAILTKPFHSIHLKNVENSGLISIFALNFNLELSFNKKLECKWFHHYVFHKPLLQLLVI
jgi:hypothetical protein